MKRLIAAISVSLLCTTIMAAQFEDALRALRDACGDKPGGGVIEFKNAGWTITHFGQGGTGIQLTDADFERISRLDSLECVGLGGEIEIEPESWKKLASLSRLTQVLVPVTTMQMLSVLTAFPRLESVDISELRLPAEAALAELKKFHGLRKLHLPGGLNDAALNRVVELRSLEELDFLGSYNVTDAGIARLAALDNLRSLRVSSLGSLGCEALARLPHLERLTIVRRAGDEAKSLDLSRFNSLQSLTQATDDLPLAWGRPLQWPPNLQSLCMSAWAMDDGGAGKSVLRHALPASVRSVRLRLFQRSPGDCVTPRILAGRKPSDLTWLQTLPNLAELELVDPLPEDLDSILALARLRRLALTGDRASLTEKQIEKVNALQQLESLTITSGCRITGAALGAIAEIKGLRELRISATRPGVTKLWALSRLEKLTLRLSEAGGGAAVDDPLLGIGALSELKELTLAGKVTDAELKNLAGLKKLKQLDLSGCEGYSDVGLAELVKSLPELTTVVWAWHREQKP